MPSFTFVSTANAFVLRGGVPVFVDIRPDTLNIDETLIEAAITPRTRAIVAGALRGRRLRDGRDHGDRRAPRPAGDRGRGAGDHARRYQRPAARAASATWRRCRFHETKNIICGEGGALLDQRRALRRARRDHPREGHQPQPVLPRPGRQVHLGGHRLVVPAERDHRRLPLGAAGGGRRHHAAAAARSGAATTTAFAELERDGLVRRPDRAGRLRATTRTCTTCCCPTWTRARHSSSA